MLTYMPRWAFRHPPRGYPAGRKWPPAWAKAKKERSLAEIKKFLGVLYALGSGKNTRMSIKDMLSEDEFSWATHVPWLKKHGVTEKWLDPHVHEPASGTR